MFDRVSNGSTYSGMNQVKFVEDSFLKNWSDMVCLRRLFRFKFFRSCPPQSLTDPFLNTLTQILLYLLTHRLLFDLSIATEKCMKCFFSLFSYVLQHEVKFFDLYLKDRVTQVRISIFVNHICQFPYLEWIRRSIGNFKKIFQQISHTEQ